MTAYQTGVETGRLVGLPDTSFADPLPLAIDGEEESSDSDSDVDKS